MKKWSNKIFAIMLGGAIVVVSAFFALKAAYPLKFYDEIEEYADQCGLRVALVCAVIDTESGFVGTKVSPKGAAGLMQLMPSTAKFVAERFYAEETGDVSDPETNIRYGTRYLKYLIEKFGSEDTALAAYNAGEGITKKWLADAKYSADGVTLSEIPYQETRRYVRRVRRAEKIYNILY